MHDPENPDPISIPGAIAWAFFALAAGAAFFALVEAVR